ncbi:hypothetical protein IQ244_23820 [Nostoc sp. LEGE 06077]|uniref:hypothetical protein n=1 Tax=Nostoc sp. LEGE 06077 TaxID=915325 RepID=UPI0018811405|nr:hypothetical protein [Nostoc sp. LEGE 06077]MBE9209469.1 hypothetical protein [Nostoc sp. LEGE 06077]
MAILSNDITTGHIRIGSSSLIDFAVWVLLVDGLHVPPFDKHGEGNRILQSQGLNAKLWHDWLRLILIHHDNRLEWHVPNIHEATEENVKSFQNVLELNNQIHNVICNEEWLSEQQRYYLEQLTQQENSYQEALFDYSGLDISLVKESTPPQLWTGNKAIPEILTRLWNEYHPLKYSNQFLSDILLKPSLGQVELNPPTNNYREIYLVDYPYEVEIFVQPIFCIVSVPNLPINQSQLESRIFQIIQTSEVSTDNC